MAYNNTWGGYKNIGTSTYVLDGNLAIVTLLCSFLAPCTYCFMFISGWYGIKFSLRRFLYFVFVGFTCFWIGVLIKYALYGIFSVKDIFRHLFPISSNAWWFFTYYVFVLLISPFINDGFEKLSNNLIRCIVLIMTVIEIAGFPNNGSSFYGLLYIYILARYLRKENITLATQRIALLNVICLLGLWSLVYFTASSNNSFIQRLSFMLLGYSNPLIIMMSATLFLLVAKLKVWSSPWINRIASSVFCVYLLTEATMHAGGYEAIYQLLRSDLLLGLLLIIMIMIVCILLGLLLSMLFECVYKSLKLPNISI